MTPKVKKLYDQAKQDNEFLDDIYIADKDTPPNLFSNEIEKHVFASVYYGWLIGKYGADKWNQNEKSILQ